MRLHYLEWGERSDAPVLLIHGLTGRGNLWGDVGRLLAGHGFHIIAYDLRGHGASDRAAEYTLAAHVEDAAHVIEQLNPAQADVIGHSIGGAVAWELATSRASLVRHLIIEDESADALPEIVASWRRWAVDWPTNFPAREEGLAFLRSQERTVEWWGASLVPASDGTWSWAFDVAAIVATAASRHERAAWDRLAQLRCPTLLIRGERSTHLNPEVAERMARTIPHGRLLTISGADHWVHRQTGAYVGAVVEFLRSG